MSVYNGSWVIISCIIITQKMIQCYSSFSTQHKRYKLLIYVIQGTQTMSSGDATHQRYDDVKGHRVMLLLLLSSALFFFSLVSSHLIKNRVIPRNILLIVCVKCKFRWDERGGGMWFVKWYFLQEIFSTINKFNE